MKVPNTGSFEGFSEVHDSTFKQSGFRPRMISGGEQWAKPSFLTARESPDFGEA